MKDLHSKGELAACPSGADELLDTLASAALVFHGQFCWLLSLIPDDFARGLDPENVRSGCGLVMFYFIFSVLVSTVRGRGICSVVFLGFFRKVCRFA